MSSKPSVTQTPFSSTTSVQDTSGDIAAYRNWQPNNNMLNANLDSQFEKSRQNLQDSYGAYTGIPSAVARKRLYDEGLADLEGGRATAMAAGNEGLQQMKGAQLESLANLTATRNQTGYNSQVQQGGGLLNTIIGAGANVAGAALI